MGCYADRTMTELATLIEKRRIAQTRLDLPIRRSKAEKEQLADDIRALDRAIDLMRDKEVE